MANEAEDDVATPPGSPAMGSGPPIPFPCASIPSSERPETTAAADRSVVTACPRTPHEARPRAGVVPIDGGHLVVGVTLEGKAARRRPPSSRDRRHRVQQRDHRHRDPDHRRSHDWPDRAHVHLLCPPAPGIGPSRRRGARPTSTWSEHVRGQGPDGHALDERCRAVPRLRLHRGGERRNRHAFRHAALRFDRPSQHDPERRVGRQER